MRARHLRETDPAFEDLLAELTDAAYRAALRQGLRGAFIDAELALWRELRAVLRIRWDAEGDGSRRASWSAWREAIEDGVLAGSR
jgi:hypothetical protein